MWILASARAGGASCHAALASESIPTGLLRSMSSAARTARCLGDPNAKGPPSTMICNGPRRPNLRPLSAILSLPSLRSNRSPTTPSTRLFVLLSTDYRPDGSVLTPDPYTWRRLDSASVAACGPNRCLRATWRGIAYVPKSQMLTPARRVVRRRRTAFASAAKSASTSRTNRVRRYPIASSSGP